MIVVMEYFYATVYPYNAGMSTITPLIAVFKSRASSEQKHSASTAKDNKKFMGELEKMMTLTTSDHNSPIPTLKPVNAHIFSLMQKSKLKDSLQGQPILHDLQTNDRMYAFNDRTFAFLLLIIRKELLFYFKTAISYVESDAAPTNFVPQRPPKILQYDTKQYSCPRKSIRKHVLSTIKYEVTVGGLNGLTKEDIVWFNHAQVVATTARIRGCVNVPLVSADDLVLPNSLSVPIAIPSSHVTNSTTLPADAATTHAPEIGFGNTADTMSPPKNYGSDSESSDNIE
jgi:hypothetical protein